MMRTRTLLLLAVLLLSGSLAHAQGTSASGSDDPARWAPFLGCWVPSGRAADADTQVCVVPAPAGPGVQMLTFAGDRELLSETIVANGSAQPATDKDCQGERSSRWASAGPRFFSSSALACAGQPAVKTTGLSALVTADRWVDVQVADTGGREQVRTRRFWRSSAPPPASIADAIRSLPQVRTALTGVSAEDVIEASRAVAALGVEAWLAESGAHVRVDRRALVRLSDAKVGANVIDLMVALAFPQKFEVRRSSSSGGGAFAGGGGFGGWVEDGSVPGDWSYLADVYGFGFGSFGVPYYMGAFGYTYPPGFYFVPGGGGGDGGGAEETTHGQVINGQGYTRVQPREVYRGTASGQGGGAQTDSASGSGGGGSSDGSSGSGGATPSGYSGGGGSGTGLTAVPR